MKCHFSTKMENRSVTFTEQNSRLKADDTTAKTCLSRLSSHNPRVCPAPVCITDSCWFLGPTIGEIQQTQVDLWGTSENDNKIKRNLQPLLLSHKYSLL